MKDPTARHRSARNEHAVAITSRVSRAAAPVNAAQVSIALIYVGAIGMLQFVSLAFSARQLQGVTIARLRRRVAREPEAEGDGNGGP